MSKPKVVVGWVHPGNVKAGFAYALANLFYHGEANHLHGHLQASNPRQEVARNDVIARFLEGDGTHLMWIDTDMTFEMDAVAQLLGTMKKTGADMVGGLGFIWNREPKVMTPCAYKLSPDKKWDVLWDYEEGAVIEVDATGAGFVLIKREVFEAMTHGTWHQTWLDHPDTGGAMGHDLAFFYRAKQLGFKLIYDTNVKTGHIKDWVLDEPTYKNWRASR
jgi:hypothetical protein